MEYQNIVEGEFLERPNRFIAHVRIAGKEEIVHVKNTGRCKELLYKGAKVFVQRADKQGRKTNWDLIGVKKGKRIINIDSQAPNDVVEEFLKKGELFPLDATICREKTFGSSRMDFSILLPSGKTVWMEVKGVTLEDQGKVLFPDAPSLRAVKHVNELIRAKEQGHDAYLFFVIQMKQVRYFTPNTDTQPEFSQALIRARDKGVKIIAYDCHVSKDSIAIRREVPVLLKDEKVDYLKKQVPPWYRAHQRDLPWREKVTGYRVWVSEIMLQQTKVEAVRPYYERFIKTLPTVKDLAEVSEDELLKLWEGLGYYSRARNLKKAAQIIVSRYQGELPSGYEELVSLPGIGPYTAGAIGAFAFHKPYPAVDGNVLRVMARYFGITGNVLEEETKEKITGLVELAIPKDSPSDFNQGLIELGALVCLPKGQIKCQQCPLHESCVAYREGKVDSLPVREKKVARAIEKKTVFVFQNGQEVVLQKRPSRGLLAGLYEFPNCEGHLSKEEAVSYAKELGLSPIQIMPLGEATHIFSHKTWKMVGYLILLDGLALHPKKEMLFLTPEEIQKSYSLPSAFDFYTRKVLPSKMKVNTNK